MLWRETARKDAQLKVEVGRCVTVRQLDSGGGRKEEADVFVIAAAGLVQNVSGGDGETQQLAVSTLVRIEVKAGMRERKVDLRVETLNLTWQELASVSQCCT